MNHLSYRIKCQKIIKKTSFPESTITYSMIGQTNNLKPIDIQFTIITYQTILNTFEKQEPELSLYKKYLNDSKDLIVAHSFSANRLLLSGLVFCVYMYLSTHKQSGWFAWLHETWNVWNCQFIFFWSIEHVWYDFDSLVIYQAQRPSICCLLAFQI